MDSSMILQEPPAFFFKCPLTIDWCVYKGEVYFAVIDYEESLKRNKPVFDLAYCATKAMNELFIKKVVWGKNKFQPWKHSTWSHAK